MLSRLISQNKFTRKRIKELTGQEVEQPIIVVGNTVQRRNVEKLLLSGKSFAIVGAPCVGKLTTILDICDRHELDFFVSYDGAGFADLPYRRPTALYIIRYDGYKQVYKKYLETSQIIFLANDDLSPSLKKGIKTFYFRKPNSFDKEEYVRLKGEDMPILGLPVERTDTLLNNASKLIHGKLSPEDYIPEAEKIIAYNYRDEGILKVCAMANRTKIPLFRWGLMNLIRFTRPQEFKYPPRLAKNDN